MFIKYVIVNGCTTLGYYVLYYLFNELLAINYLWSNGISYVISVFAGFVLSKYFVFEAKKKSFTEVFYFVVVRVLIMGASSFGLWLLVNVMGMGKYVSFIIVNGLCFLLSYSLNKWVFIGRQKHSTMKDIK